ncbi:unnamed protein product [Arabidopsis halleri]
MIEIIDTNSPEVNGSANMGKETLLLVLVGNWECSTDGWWKFIVETNCLAQCMMVSEDMSYAAVKTRIEEDFATEIEGVVQRMSYCPPSEMSMFAYGKTPPVSINSDRGLQTFLKLRAATKPLNLLVTFGCGAETDPRLLKKTATTAPIINLADGTPSIQSVDEVDSTYNAVGLTTASLGTSVADVRHIVHDNVDINGGIDLNSIYDDEMIRQLETVEEMARQEQGLKISKGKEKVTESEHVGRDYNETQDWEMYVRAEEEQYQYNVWNTLRSQEYRPLQVGETMVVGESSNAIRMCSVPESTTDERLGGVDGVPAVIDNIQVEDDNVVTEGHDMDCEDQLDEAIQLSLANIYNEIIAADVVPSHDCAPCFGDQFLDTQEVPQGVYDHENDAIFIGRIFRNKAENMEVRTATLTHTCDITSRGQYGKKASCKVIAEVLKSKYANRKLGPRAVDIPDIILDELRVSINYMKAWHSKERAVIEARGTAEDSYKLLVVYLHLLKQTNPGTVYDVVTTGYGTSKLCRRVKANKHLSPVTPEVEEILMKHLSESGGLSVAPASEAIYQVSNSKGVAFIVNLNTKTCSCKVFETLGIPCCHALAAARAHGVPIPEMVDNHYKTGEWINAYSAVVMPVPNVENADVPQELVDDETNPPQVNPGPGRPKKRRIPSIGETVGRKKKRSNGPTRCSRCFATGHNRATFRNPIP